MKKIITLVIVCLMTVCANAQSKMQIQKTDGTKLEILLSDIEKVSFQTEKHIVFQEPYFNWNCSPQEVKDNMTDYVFEWEQVIDGETLIKYQGKYEETFIGYTFDSSNQLKNVQVAVPVEKTSYEELEEMFSQDYIDITDEGDKGLWFVSKDEKTIVYISTSGDGSSYVIQYNRLAKAENPEPTGPLFEKPCTTWGLSRGNLKILMQNSGFTLMSDNDTADRYYSLSYLGKYRESFTTYCFDANRCLEEVMVTFDEDEVSIDEVKTFLLEGLKYLYYTDINDESFYVSADAMIVVSSFYGMVVVDFTNIERYLASPRAKGIDKTPAEVNVRTIKRHEDITKLQHAIIKAKVSETQNTSFLIK